MNYMESEIGIWEIAVLALLREGPMHPYQMQRLLRLRHKDEILALKRGSLYHAIRRLVRDELIAVESTERAGNRPERTVYRATAAGLATLSEVLRRIVGTPRRESSEFMAAMSFLIFLTPEEAAERLNERVRRLEAEVAGYAERLSQAGEYVPRIHLLEGEYLVSMQRAELEWVKGLRDEIQQGRMRWDLEQILREVRAGVEAASQRGEKGNEQLSDG